MTGNLKDKRIKGDALEMIMQDVLQGMMRFTEDVCAGCTATGLQIQSVEPADHTRAGSGDNVVPFAPLDKHP